MVGAPGQDKRQERAEKKVLAAGLLRSTDAIQEVEERVNDALQEKFHGGILTGSGICLTPFDATEHFFVLRGTK